MKTKDFISIRKLKTQTEEEEGNMLKNVGAGGGAGAIAEVDEEGDLTERKLVKKANTGLSVTWED